MAKDTVEIIPAAPIMDALKDQARSSLSSALGTKTLVDFSIGQLGNFPYTWQDPTNLRFNEKTYDWIKSALKAGASPTTQDGVFTNEYLTTITAVDFTYSQADQASLNQALSNAQQQQGALLNIWTSQGFSLPSGNMPINGVLTEIQTNWADPAVTLQQIQRSRDLTGTLNKTPAAGLPILPMLANYLNAMGASAALQNQLTLATGMLADVRNALNSPSASNGATVLNDSSSTFVPAYPVASSQAQILNELKNKGSQITLDMTVAQSSSSEFKVSVNGGTAFSIPILDFLTLGVGGNASYFSDEITKSSNQTSVHMAFTGPTLVSYGPMAYDATSRKGWYWMTPILDAIKNEGKDVTGYHFGSAPNIDWSSSGPFGFLTNVAITNYPSIKIMVTGSNYKSIQTQFEQNTSVKLSFLGIPLASASESTYSSSTTVDEASQTVTITLTPPPSLIANSAVDAKGWVLGVVTDYPAAS